LLAPSERVPLDPDRDLYGKILFHRGRFRRVRGYRQLSATQCVAELSPDGDARWFVGYLPDRLLLGDPAVRDATIHAIQACIPHGTILPVGVERVVPATHWASESYCVHARERLRDGDRFVYDVEVTAADGHVCERWEGLELRRVAHAAPGTRWAEPLLGPYLERRLDELVPGSAASVAVERNGVAGDHVTTAKPLATAPANGREVTNGRHTRQADSDRAIATVLGRATEVFRRADGKPMVLVDRAVSVSHTGQLTMSIAGAGRVACDAEPVAGRTSAAWQDLLSADRAALARLIVSQSADELDAAATRVWAAGECLKKAGLSGDAPLVFRAATPDGWVVLAAGEAAIATWITPIENEPEPLALAMLVGTPDAGL
jgi:enediyne polyketide synthase